MYYIINVGLSNFIMADSTVKTLSTSGGTLSTAQAKASGISEGTYITQSGTFEVRKTSYGYETVRTSSTGTAKPSPTVHITPEASQQMGVSGSSPGQVEAQRQIRASAQEIQAENPNAKNISIKTGDKGNYVITAETPARTISESEARSVASTVRKDVLIQRAKEGDAYAQAGLVQKGGTYTESELIAMGFGESVRQVKASIAPGSNIQKWTLGGGGINIEYTEPVNPPPVIKPGQQSEMLTPPPFMAKTMPRQHSTMTSAEMFPEMTPEGRAQAQAVKQKQQRIESYRSILGTEKEIDVSRIQPTTSNIGNVKDMNVMRAELNYQRYETASPVQKEDKDIRVARIATIASPRGFEYIASTMPWSEITPLDVVAKRMGDAEGSSRGAFIAESALINPITMTAGAVALGAGASYIVSSAPAIGTGFSGGYLTALGLASGVPVGLDIGTKVKQGRYAEATAQAMQFGVMLGGAEIGARGMTAIQTRGFMSSEITPQGIKWNAPRGGIKTAIQTGATEYMVDKDTQVGIGADRNAKVSYYKGKSTEPFAEYKVNTDMISYPTAPDESQMLAKMNFEKIEPVAWSIDDGVQKPIFYRSTTKPKDVVVNAYPVRSQEMILTDPTPFDNFGISTQRQQGLLSAEIEAFSPRAGQIDRATGKALTRYDLTRTTFENPIRTDNLMVNSIESGTSFTVSDVNQPTWGIKQFKGAVVESIPDEQVWSLKPADIKKTPLEKTFSNMGKGTSTELKNLPKLDTGGNTMPKVDAEVSRNMFKVGADAYRGNVYAQETGYVNPTLIVAPGFNNAIVDQGNDTDLFNRQRQSQTIKTDQRSISLSATGQRGITRNFERQDFDMSITPIQQQPMKITGSLNLPKMDTGIRSNLDQSMKFDQDMGMKLKTETALRTDTRTFASPFSINIPPPDIPGIPGGGDLGGLRGGFEMPWGRSYREKTNPILATPNELAFALGFRRKKR